MSKVSIIIPCYNEQDTLPLLLDALLQQTWPCTEMEVVIADGMSTDDTRSRLDAWQTRHPELPVRVVDNPVRHIPAGLNIAIAAAQGEVIVRLDAHSQPAPDYVERSVRALDLGHGDNVGGVWIIRPRAGSWMARAIAAAAAHPLGVGDATYRLTAAGEGRAVDTVPFGAFRKTLAQKLGGYDETLLTNEDYEFNVRIRQAGGVVWLDPSIRSVYLARRSLTELARQYWRYGYWKARMLRRYPGTLRWRQALPPLFVISLVGLAALALVRLAWPISGWLFMIELSAYALILLAAGVHAAWRRKDAGLIVGLPPAIATMHLAWGGAFLWSLLTR
jgi:glycosyltransferase involved in cell wall biosynthesis